MVWSLYILRSYLVLKHPIVYTDHVSLRWIMKVTDASGRLIIWRVRLSEFDYEVNYKKGICHAHADALYRLETEDVRWKM